MKERNVKQIAVLGLMLILFCAQVFAATSYDLGSKEFENASLFLLSGEELNIIYVDLEEVDLEYIQNKTLFIDLPQSQGFDYVITSSSDHLRVEEIGTVQGMVVDSVGNVIPNADLSFDCIRGYNYNKLTQTDKFGSFTAHLPRGSCRIITKFQNRVGVVDIKTHKGELQRIEATLNLNQYQNNKSNEKATMITGFTIAGVVIVVLLIISLRRKKALKELRKERAEQTGAKTDVHESLCKTLNYREQEIVKALQEKGTLNQSDLRKVTGLPKSTLSRIIQKLYLKNILDVEDRGNIKKISLRPDFK